MSKKRVLLGMLVVLLAFGVLVTGCKSSGEPRGAREPAVSGPQRTGAKSILEWVKPDGVFVVSDTASLRFMGESWIQIVNGNPVVGGTLSGMPSIPAGIDFAAIEAKIEEFKSFPNDVISTLESAGRGDMEGALAAAKNLLSSLENGDILSALDSCQVLINLLNASQGEAAIAGLLEKAQNLVPGLLNMANEFVQQWTNFLNNARDGDMNLTVTQMVMGGRWQTIEDVEKIINHPVSSRTVPQEVKDSVARFKEGLVFSYRFSRDAPFIILSAK